MSEQVTSLILNVIGIVISSIIVAIGYLLKRSISDKLDSVDQKLQKIDDSVVCMKVEMAKEYVRRNEYTEANKDMRTDIRELEKQINELGKAG